MADLGLKALRSGKGPVDPNKYWGRQAVARCKTCRKRVRSNNHKCHTGSTKARYGH